MSRLAITALICLLSSTAAAQVVTPQFMVEPAGQATFDTCQSYTLAAALAFKRDPNRPIDTAQQLRNTELDLRGRIVAKASRDANGKPLVKHEHIQAAFADYAGDYAIRKTPYQDVLALDEAIAARTGVTDAADVGSSFVMGAAVRDVLWVSVTRIGKKPYSQGHWVTILGIDGPPTSQRRYLLLNSAVVANGAQPAVCREGIPDEPGPYRGLVSWVAAHDIEFKKDSQRVIAWTLEKK